MITELDNYPIMKSRTEFISEIRDFQNILQNSLCIDDEQASCWTNTRNGLSRGCRCCKSGSWLCLWLLNECNLNCSYCPQGDASFKKNFPDSSETLNHDYIYLDDVIRFVDWNRHKISGISYSGGEPLLALDKIAKLAGTFSRRYSVYQWVYTNGILATKDNMKFLESVGIDEIRFHLGATNFDANVVKKLEWAARIFKRVGVETVSDRQAYKFFVTDGGLRIIEGYGVKQLNLAEMKVENDNLREVLSGEEMYHYNSIWHNYAVPTFSRKLVYSTMQHAIDNKIGVTINDCSMEAKDVLMGKQPANFDCFV